MSSLDNILALEQLDNNLFRSTEHRENFKNTLFGGQVLSQALFAAYQTIENNTHNEKQPHSLHAYFLRPGSSEKPVIYDVLNVRDGRSFCSRSVTARQFGHAIFTMSVSFHQSEKGFHHQHPAPLNMPEPETLQARMLQEGKTNRIKEYDPDDIAGAFEVVPIDTEHLVCDKQSHASTSFWFRHKGSMNNTKINHKCALAFASDLSILATALLPHKTSMFSQDIYAATIDHAMWFHHDSLRVDDWLLYTTYSPWAGNARGFSTGRIYSRDGILLASATQEGLIRPISVI